MLAIPDVEKIALLICDLRQIDWELGEALIKARVLKGTAFRPSGKRPKKHGALAPEGLNQSFLSDGPGMLPAY
jgi:hypothetical protein